MIKCLTDSVYVYNEISSREVKSNNNPGVDLCVYMGYCTQIFLYHMLTTQSDIFTQNLRTFFCHPDTIVVVIYIAYMGYLRLIEYSVHLYFEVTS